MKRKINFLRSTLLGVVILALWCYSFNANAESTNHLNVDEVAELRATVAFSTTTPKSGDNFFMDIRINSASLGTLSGLVEDLHVEFDLPSNLSIVKAPLPFGSEFSVTIDGSYVEVNWSGAVPIGAPQLLRFTLAWNAGVTLAGIDAWVNPTISVDANNCAGIVAKSPNGYDPVPDVYPTNNAAINYMITEYQNVYAALLHTATIKLKNEHVSGGLNLHNGVVSIDFDEKAYVPTIRLNGTIMPFTVQPNTPAAGRKTVVFNIPDSDLQVNGNPDYANTLQIIYNYPARTVLGTDYYDMNISYTAMRANGAPIYETATIQEELEYRIDAGPAIDLFSKRATGQLVRVNANTISYLIAFDTMTDLEDIEIIDDPKINEPDFFNAFRFTRVEVSAYDPYVDWTNRTRTKIYYEHSGNPNIWYEVPSTEVTTAGDDRQYSWLGSNLTSTDLGLGADYVTRIKFEFYNPMDNSRFLPAGAGKVQIRLFATAMPNIIDNTTSNSYNDDGIVTNTITGSGTMCIPDMPCIPFTAAETAITANTELTANHPQLHWAFNGGIHNWYYANGGVVNNSWYLNSPVGEWNIQNSAGGGSGLVRIGDVVWGATDSWLTEGGNFHDPIVYYHVPDPNIEILEVASGPSLRCYDIEYFNAPDGGTIVKFRIANTATGIPGNPEIPYPMPGWDNYIPGFGSGDPGNYGYGWGHWWVWRGNNIVLKMKFNPGAQNGSVAIYITSGDPEQVGRAAPLTSTSPLVLAGAAVEGQTVLSSRGFGYTIDRTTGLNPIATVSTDNISYVQIETIDNSSSPVDVYLKMSIENPALEIYGNLSKIRLIDALPCAGDTMATTSGPKGSTGSLVDYEVYSVKLNDTEIPFVNLDANGIRVYYSATANFMTNRQALRDVTAAVASHWTQTMAGTIPDGAKAVMIEKDGLNQGDKLEIILKATAPISSNTSKYWHSFAATGRYGTTNIIPGEPLKAGFTGLGSNPVTVSGRVWNDLNRNGIQDAGEPGWPDLMMRLYDDQNNEVDMVITGSNGEYAFTRDFDANSTWHIQFMLPEDYVLTKYRAAAATEQTNSDYIMYQSVPTVFFTFGAIAEDINNLDAGIYDGNNDITFHLSSGTVGVHNLTQEGSVDANNYLLPPTAWYADQAQHMTTEWYDNPSYTGTPWNFATDEVTGVLDLYAYDNVADNQGSLQRAFDYAPFTTILVRGESTDTVELTSTVTSWATRTVNDGTITLKAFTAATGNFILSPNAAVRHIRVTTAGTYKLNFIDVQFTGRNVNPAANGIAGGGISFTNTGAIISLAAENAIAGFSNITNCFATNVPELDAANGQSYGGGVYSRGAMTIDGSIKISNNRAQNGGGVNVESGTFVMNGGIINGNRAVYWGGGLRNAYATFTMNNGEFTGNDAGEDGGGVMNFADFIMKGGKIYSNTALGGGGVGQAWRTVNVGADFAMEGGEIYNNNAVYEGGGVWSYGNIVMSGGKIYGNTTAGNGGGAWKGWGGTFIITNGEIYNNSATGSWGGGICSYNSVVVSGGKIYNNTARIRGGGVYVAVDQHPSSFTLSGGEIYNNSTTAANGDGGGVYSEGAVIISDGIISDNRARDGGGIYSEGTVNATGGRINNNTATRDGGGIYTTKYENLYISSNVIFYENDASRYVEWLVSGDAAEWSILRNIYLIQNPGFPLDNQITEIPGLTLGAGGDYDNLYNNYDVNITVVELTYNANFGITPETVVKKYLQGEPCPISSNMFTYPGWNFVEWNTQSDGEGDSYAPGSTITMTGSITLYAIWEVGATVTLNLKLFLQGPTKNGNYTFKGEAKNGTYMTNYIQAPRFPWFTELYLPIDNPYGIPGSYPEINSVTGPAYEVVDWVLVEIWGNFNESTYTYDLLETRALLLQVDGSVVDVNGNLPEFDVQQGDVRIVVKHRNHLAVMSSEGLSFTSGTVEYDFSTGINKAYTLPLPIFPAQMIIKNNVAALIAGDLNTDYVINATDINIFNNAFYLTSGLWRYLVTDINMDGVVDAADSSLILDNFYLRSSYSVLRFCTKN